MALFSLASCNYPQITSIFQGANVPVISKTSSDLNKQVQSEEMAPSTFTPLAMQTPTEKSTVESVKEPKKPS